MKKIRFKKNVVQDNSNSNVTKCSLVFTCKWAAVTRKPSGQCSYAAILTLVFSCKVTVTHRIIISYKLLRHEATCGGERVEARFACKHLCWPPARGSACVVTLCDSSKAFSFLFFKNAAACEMLMNCGVKMFHPLTQQWTGGWRWSWG